MVSGIYLVLVTMSISIFFSGVLFIGLIFNIPLRLYLMWGGELVYLDWQFVFINSCPINLTLIFDFYGVLFSCVVMFISLNVFIFAEVYMQGEIFIRRFSLIVILFILSINILVFIPNFISLLLGWDGLGLTSFLLVIYYQNAKSLGAGIITALTNRIGDALIVVGIVWMFNQGHWLVTCRWAEKMGLWIVIFVLVASMTKSAQVPFSSWLPAAMAAPTPVSALVHSSTLVTAGVFLLFRFFPLLSSFPAFCPTLLFFATLTSVIAGMSAMTECDIKKIIALSTLRQLGVIIVGLGLAAPFFAFFHLVTHALFKALLFICAGSLIHLHSHSQDLRFMGNLVRQCPLIGSSMMVSNLALCGAPFLAGFYSKDLILEIFLFRPRVLLLGVVFFFATGLTSRYTIRFLLSVVWGPNQSVRAHCVSDGRNILIIPIMLLSLASIFRGSIMNWVLFVDCEEMVLPLYMKLLVVFVTVVGVGLSWVFNAGRGSGIANLMVFPSLNYRMRLMWFLSSLSTQHLLGSRLWVGHQLLKVVDQG